MRIAVLASGRGSNLRNILELSRQGKLSVKPVLVLSNNPEAAALDYAAQYGVPTWSQPHTGIPRAEFDAQMRQAIEKSGAELIVLAGYMRLLGSEFIRAFAGRIINLHPALLPSFPGIRGGEDALNYRVTITGCSVHFVEEAVDSGPIIIQAAVPVSPSDNQQTLMRRIHEMEYRIYPQALEWLAKKRLTIQGRTVQLLPRPGQDPNTLQPGSSGPSPLGPWLTSPALEDF